MTRNDVRTENLVAVKHAVGQRRGRLVMAAAIAASLLYPLTASAQTPPAGNTNTPPVTLVADAGPDGFGVRTSDNAFRLRIKGIGQYDGRAFLNDKAKKLTDGAELRRVRFDLQGTVYSNYDFRFYLDYAGNVVQILDAYVEGRFSPSLAIRAGKFKSPVGLERLQTINYITFAERGFPTLIAPNRDAGIQLSGMFGGQRLSYQLGVFNGVPDGGSGDTDLADSKDFEGRIFVQPFATSSLTALRGLGVGVAGTIGDQTGTAAAPGVATYRTTIGRGNILRFRNDNTTNGSVIVNGQRTRLVPQGSWYWKNLGSMAEWAQSVTNVKIGGANWELATTAWQAAASWVVTGEAASYRGVVPRTPFDRRAGTWGAFEVAGRVHRLETDAAAFPVLANPAESAQAATAYTAGLNWYLNRIVRVEANFEHTDFKAAPGGVKMPSENALITRFQVGF